MNYINPLTKIYSSFTEAKEDFDKYGHMSLFDDRKPLAIVDLAKGSRNLIVGEPGIGKSLLINKLKEYHDVQGDKTHLINLRSNKPAEQIDIFVAEKAETKKILLLDALDETQANNLPDILQKIESISKDHPEIIIYLSSRWIFINKYSNSFPEYRYIIILPFTTGQVKEYLVQAGNTDRDVESLLSRLMQFGHGKPVLQIPRYLFYLDKYIKEKSISSITSISRNDLFEYFIYSKLDLEDKKLNTNKKEIIKRMLEKLALIMEIYQTNNISKDELMTFFDDINSDLKVVVLSQINLEIFIDKTILQESAQDLSRIEFENTEFQEYLAAKEITRFDEPHRVAFSFAVDQNINEILPSWFNTLTFLVDLLPVVLEQLLEFSGIRSVDFRVTDDSFFGFLSRVNSENVPPDFKHKVFIDVLNYHERALQWLSGQLASALPGFFDASIENELKSHLEKAEIERSAKRNVPVANIVYIVAYLLKAKIVLDSFYWRKKFIAYVNDKNEDGVVKRHALLALETLGDPTIIDELPDPSEISDELVTREFLSTCVALNPDNPRTLKYSMDAVRRNDLSGRYGLLGIKEKSSIITFLKTYNEDEQLRKEFLDDTSIFKEQDSELVTHITQVFDSEIEEFSKEAVAQSIKSYLGHTGRNSAFIVGLVKLLRERSPDFLSDLLNRLKGKENNIGLYYAQDILAEILEVDDVPGFIDFMIKENEINSAMSTLTKIKYSNRDSREKIYEAGRLKLSTQYTEWEIAQSRNTTTENNSHQKAILKDFQHYLEPSPGKYTTGVFDYYNHHFKELDPLLSDKEKDRFKKLITDEVFKHNPAAHGLTITEEHNGGGTKTYTTSQIVHLFGEAILAAKHLEMDVASYRSNIALYIPFAYHNELEALFELIKDFTPTELASVVAIYKDKNTDLWRHQPESFIKIVERYHVIDAVSVLREFVKETRFSAYTRQQALQATESLSSDSGFLKEIFNLYIDSEKSEEKEIAYAANGLLITAHGDKEALTWRLSEIKKRATTFTPPHSGFAHMIGPTEEELRHGKPFARPLIELKKSGFENEYLEILDNAIEVWGRGKDFQTYAQYMWEVVYSYFENLKEYKTYTPLKLLEKKIASLQNKEGANWLAYGLVKLRRSYLYKPNNISEAIRKYNEAKTYNDKKIQNSTDLFLQLQNAIETDLKKWIEGEGAYSIILSEKKPKGNSKHEEFTQKIIKIKLDSILIKAGFQVDIAREEQLYDGKRTDLIVRYGFVGPIVLEIKLSSNGDMKSSKMETTKSYASMERYMNGYGASHGIFLIIDNTGVAIHITRAKVAFAKIKNVWPVSLDCYTLAKKKVSKTKTVVKVIRTQKSTKKSIPKKAKGKKGLNSK